MIKNTTSAGGTWLAGQCSTTRAYVCEGVAAPGTDLQACVDSIQPRDDLQGPAREHAYQLEIARRCSNPNGSACLNELRTRVNLDFTAAAIALASEQTTPAQMLATDSDRERKAKRFESDPVWAAQLCASADDDGDLIVNASDQCPGTTALTPTNDQGCPDMTLPPAPSAADVKTALSHMGFALNSACSGAFVLPNATAGAFYRPSTLESGVFIFAGRVTNQPVGCPVWYVFDIDEVQLTSDPPGYVSVPGGRYLVTYMDREESTALLARPTPVPTGYIQFNPRPADVGSRGRLGSAPTHVRVRFRVKVFNGGGMQSSWSGWQITTVEDCKKLGFACDG